MPVFFTNGYSQSRLAGRVARVSNVTRQGFLHSMLVNVVSDPGRMLEIILTMA